MQRDEFRQELLILSDFEKELKQSGGVDNLFLSKFPHLYDQDENGIYKLTSSKLLVSSQITSQSRIHSPIERDYFQNRLRLLVHSRFSTIPFHTNEFISINYVYHGKLGVIFPNKSLTLTEGQILFMNTNVVHSLKIKSEEDLIFSFQIEKEFLTTELLLGLSSGNPVIDFLVETIMGRESNFDYMIVSYNQDDKMRFLIEDIFCEYLDPGVYSQQLIENDIKKFLIFLLRGKTEQVKLRTKADILAIISYIEMHYTNCRLEDLAREYHFSSKYLSRLIKEKTGYSFSELLSNARLRVACYYLKNSQANISEIVSQCGYSSQNYFYKKFREKYNMTPKEYRETEKILKPT